MQPTIIIAGAGLDGLTLTQIFNRHGINTTIYEAESSPHICNFLDIHENSGQHPLNLAGLINKFRFWVRPNENAKPILNHDGVILYDQTENASSSLTMFIDDN